MSMKGVTSPSPPSQLALTHPSYTTSCRQGHVVHDPHLLPSISHCGIRKPRVSVREQGKVVSRRPKSGLEGLLEAAMASSSGTSRAPSL